MGNSAGKAWAGGGHGPVRTVGSPPPPELGVATPTVPPPGQPQPPSSACSLPALSCPCHASSRQVIPFFPAACHSHTLQPLPGACSPSGSPPGPAGKGGHCTAQPRRTSLPVPLDLAGAEAGSCGGARGTSSSPPRRGARAPPGPQPARPPRAGFPSPKANSRAGSHVTCPCGQHVPHGSWPCCKSQGAGRRWSCQRL